ncbi:MAG: class I SAM-dependent methyltransferase [Actinobacteria bacterium]|nr:class I SAM-dependent methyltransferase [Actinomycetota bacterium]
MTLGPIDPAQVAGDPVSVGSLPLTGERTVPEIAEENYWYRRHEVVYQWAAERWVRPDRRQPAATPRVIIDAGCGEGYGAALLASAASDTQPKTAEAVVVGLELDVSAAEHAARRYDRLDIVRSNLDALPIASSQATLLVSLQVVEHLWDLAGFIKECVRVLADGGVAVISTPNRLTFSPGLRRGEKPTNPFHVEEFDADQLLTLLDTARLSDVHCFGLHHGSRISAWEQVHGSIVDAQIRAAVAANNESAPTADDARSRELDHFVSSITTADFNITEVDLNAAQDLIVVGRVGVVE